MNNYLGFTSVRDSKENLYSSSILPMPPKFSFQERSGHINWRLLMNTDIERIVRDVDLKQLESLLQNITFAQLDRDDLERLGDQHFIKLFKLSQLSIEYLLYTQSYLESLCKALDLQYKHTYEKTHKIEEAIKKYQVELKTMRKELKLKQKTLSTYEYLMKVPTEQEQEVIRCKHCHKFFVAKSYLQKHYLRHHPDQEFNRDFQEEDLLASKFSKTARTQQPEPQQPRINQEELLDKIKSELFTSLTDNFNKLEKDITDIKDKQKY